MLEFSGGNDELDVSTRLPGVLAAMVCAAGLLHAQSQIHLKNIGAARQQSASPGTNAGLSRVHYLIEFPNGTPEDLAGILESRNAWIVRAMPGSAYLISASSPADLIGTGFLSIILDGGANSVQH